MMCLNWKRCWTLGWRLLRIRQSRISVQIKDIRGTQQSRSSNPMAISRMSRHGAKKELAGKRCLGIDPAGGSSSSPIRGSIDFESCWYVLKKGPAVMKR